MKIYATSRISRRLGERFFFKAERDQSPKSAMARRPYPPGMHGKKRRRGRSDFGIELSEKQKIRFLYGITNAMLKRYTELASANAGKGKTKMQALLELLELRLDNVVFRLGLAPSRRTAHHLISYGHFAVNEKPIRTPSILLRTGDSISVAERSRALLPFEGLVVKLKKYQPPEWLELVPDEYKGKVKRTPTIEDNLISQDLSKVIEFYSH